MSKNAVAKKDVDTVRSALERMKPQLKMALPRHLTPERLVRVTMTAVQNTPKLLECDRTSLFAAVVTCAQLGLEPDGVLGQAYLVPFKKKVQFIPGYKGLLTLARNSGEISSIQAHEVCENDEFSYAYGLEENLHHRPAEGERGAMTHFYAYAKFKDGGHVFEVMTKAQVERIRDQSEGYKAFKSGYTKSSPWEDHFEQMGRKTAIRRLANYLPMSVQRAAAFEDAFDRGDHATTDDYGDLVIDAESQTVEDVEGNGAAAATSKLDALADEGDGESEPEGTDDAEAQTQAEEEALLNNPLRKNESRFTINDDGDVFDQETGEIVPEEFVKRFDNDGFSVLQGYHQPKKEQPASEEEDETGLFSAEA